MILQEQPRRIERTQVCANQSGVMLASNTESSAYVPDFASCNHGLPPNLPSQIQSNSFTPSDIINQDIPTPFGNYKSSVAMVPSTSSITAVGTGFPVLGTDLQSPAAPRFGSNSNENMSHNSNQGWDVKKSDPSHNQNLMCASMDSLIPTHNVLSRSSQMLDSRNTVCNGTKDYIMTGRMNPFSPLTMQHNEVEQSAIRTTVKLTQGHIVDQTELQDGHSYDDVGCFEDLASVLMKEVSIPNSQFVCFSSFRCLDLQITCYFLVIFINKSWPLKSELQIYHLFGALGIFTSCTILVVSFIFLQYLYMPFLKLLMAFGFTLQPIV